MVPFREEFDAMRRIGTTPQADESADEPPDDHDTLDDALSVTEAWLQGANGTVANAETVVTFLDAILAKLTTLRQS
jgi:hypothetical protein